MSDIVTEYRIARALRSGPPGIRDGAKVVEMDADGNMTVLREGTNEMGMQWMMDILAGKPKPTSTSPGLIYRHARRRHRDHVRRDALRASAHLRDPWEGNEYQPDVEAVWTMAYRPTRRS
jgi:hypothetical protein